MRSEFRRAAVPGACFLLGFVPWITLVNLVEMLGMEERPVKARLGRLLLALSSFILLPRAVGTPGCGILLPLGTGPRARAGIAALCCRAET